MRFNKVNNAVPTLANTGVVPRFINSYLQDEVNFGCIVIDSGNTNYQTVLTRSQQFNLPTGAILNKIQLDVNMQVLSKADTKAVFYVDGTEIGNVEKSFTTFNKTGYSYILTSGFPQSYISNPTISYDFQVRRYHNIEDSILLINNLDLNINYQQNTQKSTSHRAPRLGTWMQQGYPSQAFLNSLNNLHLYDVLAVDVDCINNFVPGIYIQNDYFSSSGLLITRNPNLILLGAISAGDINRFPGSVFTILRQVADESEPYKVIGISGDKTRMFSFGNVGEDGQENFTHTYNYFLPNTYKFLPNLLQPYIVSRDYFDGFFYDWGADDTFSFLNNVTGSGGNIVNSPVDLNLDGSGDSAAFINQTYISGLKALYNYTSAIYTGCLIVGNAGWNSTFQYPNLHGTFWENFNINHSAGQTWADRMKNIYHYQVSGIQPRLDIIQTVSSTPSSFNLMRYGLASTLMFDSVYYNHTNKTNGTSYEQTWFYAEFSQIGGTGTTNSLGKGWLGNPTTQAYNINNTSESLITCLNNGTANNKVFARDYDNGIAIVNPTSNTASVTVAGYAKLYEPSVTPTGMSYFPDSSWNDGSQVTTFNIPASGGVILRTYVAQGLVVNSSGWGTYSYNSTTIPSSVQISNSNMVQHVVYEKYLTNDHRDIYFGAHIGMLPSKQWYTNLPLNNYNPNLISYSGAFKVPFTSSSLTGKTLASGGYALAYNPNGNNGSGSLYITNSRVTPVECLEISIPTNISSGTLASLKQSVNIGQFIEPTKGWYLNASSVYTNFLSPLIVQGLYYHNSGLMWSGFFEGNEPTNTGLRPLYAGHFNTFTSGVTLWGYGHPTQKMFTDIGGGYIIPIHSSRQAQLGYPFLFGNTHSGVRNAHGPTAIGFNPMNGVNFVATSSILTTSIFMLFNSGSKMLYKWGPYEHLWPNKQVIHGGAWLFNQNGHGIVFPCDIGEYKPEFYDSGTTRAHNFTITGVRYYWQRSRPGLLFVNPDNLYSVSQSSLSESNIEPYCILDIGNRLIASGDIGGCAYDATGQRLFIVERNVSGTYPVIHLFRT